MTEMLLSKLIEFYIESENDNRPFSRSECMYFSKWAQEMLESGQDSEALREAAAGFDMTEPERAKICLENVITELYGISEINEELHYKIAVNEYESGKYPFACEFLCYNPVVAQKLGFPYTIEDDGNECYAAEKPELRYTELEDHAVDFLAGKGIIKGNGKYKPFGK